MGIDGTNEQKMNGGPGGTAFFEATARKNADLPGRCYRIADEAARTAPRIKFLKSKNFY